MPLNSSGPLSLNGSTVGQSIGLELGKAATAQISLNDTDARTLAGIASGQISLSSFYGKSSLIFNFRGYWSTGRDIGGTNIQDTTGFNFSTQAVFSLLQYFAANGYYYGTVASSFKGYTNRGFNAINLISKLEFSTESSGFASAELVVNRYGAVGMSSGIKGYFAGGRTTVPVSEIDGIDFSTETSIDPAAVLSPTREYAMASASSAYNGYTIGGYNNSSEINGINFVSETAFNPSATISLGEVSNGGTSSAFKGYIAGGVLSGDNIYSVDFTNDTVLNLAAKLSVSRYNTAGISSATAGYWSAGISNSTGFVISEIDGINFTTEVAVNPTASLIPARYGHGGFANNKAGGILGRGYYCGGTSANQDEIDGIDFSTEAAINPTAVLTVGRWYLAGVSSAFKGYLGGGASNTGIQNITDNLNFSTEVVINIAHTMSVGRRFYTGVNSAFRGYFAGGIVSGTGNDSDEIDGINFSTEAAINPAAALATARHGLAGVSSSFKGYFGGGSTGSYDTAEIDGIDFSTEAAINPAISLDGFGRRFLTSVSSAFKGYFVKGRDGGGETSLTDGINFYTESYFIVSNALGAKQSAAGVSSSFKGYIGAGGAGAGTASIDGIDFSTDTWIDPAAILSSARQGLAGVQSFKPNNG